MRDPRQAQPSAPTWYLEGILDNSRGKTWRTVVRPLPFLVGRKDSSDLSLRSQMISQRHARLFERGGKLWVDDLGSTNGTFVNGKQVDGEHELREGDVIQFADVELRLLLGLADGTHPHSHTVHLDTQILAGGAVRARQLRAMLADGTYRAIFQPLIHMASDKVLGYEALGRGALEGVETLPGELFLLAESIGLASEMSASFRDCAAEIAEQFPGKPLVFLNTHPEELNDLKTLLESVGNLRIRHPDLDLVLEIHESAIPGIQPLRTLRERLGSLEIDLAFDDFGTGQARLLEIIDIIPHYLKFDALFIRDIHLASDKRREMVEALVKMTREMGISAVAEGIESEAEAQACRELGFDLAQGYFFGMPAPIESYLKSVDSEASSATTDTSDTAADTAADTATDSSDTFVGTSTDTSDTP